MAEHDLDGAPTQAAHPGTLAARPQQLEMPFEVPQMAIDTQGPPRLAGEGVEVLVARERTSLLVEAPHQTVEKLAHISNLPLQPGENRLDFHWEERAVRRTWAASASPAAPRQ